MESSRRRPEQGGSGKVKLPEIPTEPLEFLARSWSPSALQLCKALSLSPRPPPPPRSGTPVTNGSNMNIAAAASTTSHVINSGGGGENEESTVAGAVVNNSTNNGDPPQPSFLFASSSSSAAATTTSSQLVLERIMSQSEMISPLTSGRLSHSSSSTTGALNGIGSLTHHDQDTDSISPPVVSPTHEFDDVVKFLRSNNTLQPLFIGGHNSHGGGSGGVSTPSSKTGRRWLKERKEKKKQEARAHNAQLHAVVSVANVAAAVAAIAAATAAASATGKDDKMAKTDMAVASAATLVAGQCVEAAEVMGADRCHLISAISSAVNVRTHDDITTLTAAAATALRGAAALKARALKDVWSIGAAVPAAEKGTTVMRMSGCSSDYHEHSHGNGFVEGLALEDDFLDSCHQQLLARGTELLKRTRKGDLHWKIVSVYIHRTGQVMLKMKSRHAAGTITKKDKNVVLEVCRDVKPWPGRHLFEGGEQRLYFGLKTVTRGVVEFECKNQREHDIWTQGVRRLLSIAAEKNNLNN
ncbi:VAN3-binding protein-like [Rhododendron vialii]|uniref:VAN3-binding protein-like n=1 Tax=Rhododendron vialii TaxID=182163 RepID=UPI00265FF172|nr:VAN3-binding protein-like [Rhododendron vialii]